MDAQGVISRLAFGCDHQYPSESLCGDCGFTVLTCSVCNQFIDFLHLRGFPWLGSIWGARPNLNSAEEIEVIKIIWLSLLAFVISGCENTGAPLENDVTVKQGVYLKLDSIDLGNGEILPFDGRLVRYDLLRNEKGTFDRYTLNSSREMMSFEVDTFWNLARKGYVRKVRRESANRYVVNYVLKGKPTIIADYRELTDKGAKSRVTITRKTLN